MKREHALYLLLQMNGGTFPTGGFSQSWGLETYVAEGAVHDADSFRRFLQVYLESGIGKCEGPILCRAWDLVQGCEQAGGSDLRAGQQEAAEVQEERGDGSEIRRRSRDSVIAPATSGNFPPETVQALRELEQLSAAAKVTRESREGALRMGKAFLRIMAPVLGTWGAQLREVFGSGVSYPVIYGAVCGLLGLEREEAVTGYVFSTINTLTQSALKLIPLGNAEAQQVVYEMQTAAAEVTSLCMETPMEEISNFCPGIDIAGLRHEELPVRLYMS